MLVSVLLISSTSGIVFKSSAGTFTNHTQSAKDIDPYFKSQLYVKNAAHRKPVLILPNRLSKNELGAHDRNLISAMGGIRTHNLFIDNLECFR